MYEIKLSVDDELKILNELERLSKVIELDIYIEIKRILQGAIDNKVLHESEIKWIISLLEQNQKKKHILNTDEEYTYEKQRDTIIKPKTNNRNSQIVIYQAEVLRFRRFMLGFCKRNDRPHNRGIRFV